MTPLDGAFTKPVASAHLGGDARRAQGRTSRPTSWSSGSTPSGRCSSPTTSARSPFDLLVTVPLNMGADFVARSGLGDELNYVPVDKHTLLSTAYDNIFALGDASDIPTSKAGSVAHFSVEIFVDNFLEHVAGRPMTGAFDGHANCFVESGDGKALLIDFNYDTEPLTGQVPAARRRPAGPAEGDPRQPPREARVPLDLLERPAPRPPRPAAGPDVDGRQARTRRPNQRSRRPEMPTTTIDGHEIHVDDEGFLTEYDEWTEDLGTALAAQIGIELTDEHWKAIRFLRERLPRAGRDRDAAPGGDASAASRPSSCSRCSPRSRPRRWPTSPGCPSRAAACEPNRRPIMTTTETAPLVPSFDEDGDRPQARDHLLQGQPRHGLPRPDPGQRRPRRGRRDAPVLHLLGLRHDQQEDDGRPEVHDARQHRHPHAAGPRRPARA